MLPSIWNFVTSPTVQTPILICTSVLYIVSVYDNAILIRSKGDRRAAQRLYAQTGLFVLLPISTMAVLYASVVFAMERDFGTIFAPLVVLAYIGGCMVFYALAYVLRPELPMESFGDRFAQRLLGRFVGDDLAVIIGRGVVTIFPFAAVILTVLRHYGL